jgi:hypothetical protein
VISRLQPGRRFEREDLQELARHITEFSLQAMAGLRDKIGAPQTQGAASGSK